MLIGLTGGIASGKSAVARRMVDVHGAHLIDADAVARHVVEPGTPGLAAIVNRFGSDVLAPDGTLDRPALGRLVFADPAARADLEAITHPPVVEEIARRIAEARPHHDLVVVDVPLLVEVGVDRDYDAIVVVATHPPTQRARLIGDRGMDPDDADRRIASQAPLAEKLAVATHVVWNEGTPAERDAAVDRMVADLRARG